MKFEPPYERSIPNIKTESPYGVSPDGQWIVSSKDLPELPIPKQVTVTKDFLEFDGWVFPLACVTKGLLVWLQATFLRWIKEDGRQENRDWVTGIVEAFQDAVAGES